MAEDIPSGQRPAEVLGRPYLSRSYVLVFSFLASFERGQMGLEMDSRKAIWAQGIEIGGHKAIRRKGSEAKGWLEEVRRPERGEGLGACVIVVHLGEEKKVCRSGDPTKKNKRK